MASRRTVEIVLAFAALYLIWGSTYLGILFAIKTIPPFLMAGVRFLTAGAIMYLVARVKGAPAPALSTWKSAAIIGGCLLLCGNGGVTISEQWVPTGLAALLVATVPIDVALLGWITGTAPRPTPLVAFGLIGGFVGVGVLAGPALTHAPAAQHIHPGLGIVVLLLGSLIWSAGSLYSSRLRHAHSLIVAAGQQMICGGALLGIVGLSLGEFRGFDVRTVSALSAWAFVYLVLVGAIVGYTAYFYLLRHCDAAKVATYAYVNPVVAILLGTLFAGERLNLRTVVGAALIIGSVAIVIGGQQMRARSERLMATELAGVNCSR
jgi:drug/metabolite transporter (DMT)-like permease